MVFLSLWNPSDIIFLSAELVVVRARQRTEDDAVVWRQFTENPEHFKD